MSKFEKPVNPIFVFLEKVFNLMLANVLFLVCSLPVVTLGASLAGLIQVAQDQFYQEDRSVIPRFFQAFRENFLQATLAWGMLVLFLGGMLCNVLLILTYCQGWIAQLLYILAGVLTALVLAIMSYLFPMIVRYRNPMKIHLNNSLILAVVKLPRTLLMLLLNTLIFWIPFFSLNVFLGTMIFWLILGFGFIAFTDARILVPVFRQMEEDDTVELMN